jgi:hypothetical protein
MERSILYLIQPILQQVERLIPHVLLGSCGTKTGGHAARPLWVRLLPQIIIGFFSPGGILRTILFEDTLKDHHVTGRHVHDFESDVVRSGVNVIRVAPFTAGNENHCGLIGYIGGKLYLQPEILSGWDLLGTIQFETACADV